MALENKLFKNRVVSAVKQYYNCNQWSDREIAEKIYADGVNILVDLKGYTTGTRLSILNYRPAPIQIHYLGYPGSLGMPCIDYIIADPVLIEPNEAQHFTEKIVYLPSSYQINDRQRFLPKFALSRSAFNLPEKAFVFCCFNQPYKISEDLFSIWMDILKNVPHSVLWLWEKTPWFENNLQSYAKKLYVDPNRIIFAENLPYADHLARYLVADLCLDTVICNGHTTTSDALWMGCPVITIKGKTWVSRVSASLLGAAKLPNLITHNLAEYKQLAVQLANDPILLNQYKMHLINNRFNLPLFDSQTTCQAIEEVYQKMWEDYVNLNATRSNIHKT